MVKHKIDITIGTKDRPTEVALLLQSLRTQTFKNFNILIVDDAGGTPIEVYYFIQNIINRLRLEGIKVVVLKNGISHGVSRMRQQCVDYVMEHFDGDLIARIDDDTICEPDYLQKLVETIDEGWDLASGITPPIMQAEWKRDTKEVKPIINRVVLDDNGEFVINGDDCGYAYIQDEIIPTHHFRSSCVYKKDIHKAGIDYKTNLSKSGMREEEIFSFKCLMAGFKLAVRTGAVHYHQLTPSGGQRFPDHNDLMKINEEVLKDWVKKKFKENGNFIDKYNEKLGIGKEEELASLHKTTNFIMK